MNKYNYILLLLFFSSGLIAQNQITITTVPPDADIYQKIDGKEVKQATGKFTFKTNKTNAVEIIVKRVGYASVSKSFIREKKGPSFLQLIKNPLSRSYQQVQLNSLDTTLGKFIGIMRVYNEITQSDYSQLLYHYIKDMGTGNVSLVSHYYHNPDGMTLSIVIGKHGTITTIYNKNKIILRDTIANKYSKLFDLVVQKFPDFNSDSLFMAKFITMDIHEKGRFRINEYENWQKEMVNNKEYKEYEIGWSELSNLYRHIASDLALPLSTKAIGIAKLYDRKMQRNQLYYFPQCYGSNELPKNDPIKMGIRPRRGDVAPVLSGRDIIPGFISVKYQYNNHRVCMPYPKIMSDLFAANFVDKEFEKELASFDTSKADEFNQSGCARISTKNISDESNLYLSMNNGTIPRQPGDAVLLNTHLYSKQLEPLRSDWAPLSYLHAPGFPYHLAYNVMYKVCNPPYTRYGTALNAIIGAYEYESSGNAEAALQQYMAAYIKTGSIICTEQFRSILRSFIILHMKNIYQQKGQTEYARLLDLNYKVLALECVHPYNTRKRNDYYRHVVLPYANEVASVAAQIQKRRQAIASAVIGALTMASSAVSKGSSGTTATDDANMQLGASYLNAGSNIASTTSNNLQNLNVNTILSFASDNKGFDEFWNAISQMTSDNLTDCRSLIKKHEKMRLTFEHKLEELVSTYIAQTDLNKPDLKLFADNESFKTFIDKFRDHEVLVFNYAIRGLKK